MKTNPPSSKTTSRLRPNRVSAPEFRPQRKKLATSILAVTCGLALLAFPKIEEGAKITLSGVPGSVTMHGGERQLYSGEFVVKGRDEKTRTQVVHPVGQEDQQIYVRTEDFDAGQVHSNPYCADTSTKSCPEINPYEIQEWQRLQREQEQARLELPGETGSGSPASGKQARAPATTGTGTGPQTGTGTGSSSTPKSGISLDNTRAFEPSASRQYSSAVDNEIVTTGRTHSHRGATQPVKSDQLGSVLSATRIAQRAKGVELVQSALKTREIIQGAAREDDQSIRQLYRDLPIERLSESFDRAQKGLSKTAQALENAVDGMFPGQRKRFRNIALNGAGLFGAANETLNEAIQQKRLSPIQPFAGLKGPADPKNVLARTQALKEIFGDEDFKRKATSNDALTQRMGMLYGLPQKDREAAFKNLKLAERPKLKLKNGQSIDLMIPHNGYYLGGGNRKIATAKGKVGGLDCSMLTSRLIDPDNRVGTLTTLDLRAIWIQAKTGKFEKPPHYQPERKKMIKRVATGFHAIDLYAGENLSIGDLLFYRFTFDTTGHVFLVKDFDRDTMRARVIEAAQSAGTVRERDLELSIDPTTAPRRRMRPGYFALRVKATDTEACTYGQTSGTSSQQIEIQNAVVLFAALGFSLDQGEF